MPGSIIVRLTEADRERLKTASKARGVPAGTFAREAIIVALEAAGDLSGPSVAVMVREIHAHMVQIAGETRPPPVAEAVDALVQLGWTEARAMKRVTALHGADPETSTEDLITAALRLETDNGRDTERS